MTNGHYFHCLSCHGSVNGSLITEEDIVRHMATQHRNRIVRYWMVNDNTYTNSFDEYCQWMNINNCKFMYYIVIFLKMYYFIATQILSNEL